MNSAVANGTNVVEYVRSLTDEEKEIVFAELVDEVIRIHGNKNTISIPKPEGGLHGYLVPAGPAEANLRVRIPDLTPEEQEATKAALANPDDTFDMDEFLDELKRQDQD